MAEDDDNKAFFSDREISSFRQYEDPNVFNLANQSLPIGYNGFREPVSHQLQFHQQPSSDGITGYAEVEEKMDQEIIDPIENHGSSVSPMESGLAYMRSEDANKNFALFASLIDEPEEQKIIKLNQFYSQNKVIQGLNCFFMLDNGSHHHHPINFSEDPNFSLDQNFFEEKTKNNEISSMSHHQQEQKQQQQVQQSLQEQTQQENICGNHFQDNKTEDDKVFLNEFIEGYLQNEEHNQNELSQQQLGKSHQQTEGQQNSEERTQNQFILNNIYNSEGLPQFSPVFNNQQPIQQQYQQQQQQQQPLSQPQNGQQHQHQQQQQPPPHQATYSHMFNLHEAAAKVSSKNAMQKSSASFLDKVNFAVDDFLDKADPTEYPALSRGEDFLLRNLRNYLALEFTQKEQTSYFQKILNSSYQIFLHRLKLLIDQKRMDTKTLLPFICRFSIDIAEKLLQFIYKCDDAFTMKIIREHPFPSQDDHSFQPAEPSMNFQGLENLRRNFMASNGKKDNRTPSHAHSLSEASQSSASHASVFPFFNDFEHGKNESQSCFQDSTSVITNNTLDPRTKNEQGNTTQQQSMQQQYHFPGENIEPEEEEEEDCLPFAPSIQQSQQFQNDNRRGQRKPWSRQELQILNNLYKEYQQKIPPWKMEELTKKFNRSIQSIQSKVQKMRRSANSHPVTLASSFTLPAQDNYMLEGGSNKTPLSSTIFAQSQKVSDVNKTIGHQSQQNPFGNLSQNSQLGGNLTNSSISMGMNSNSTILGGNLGLIKMENKLRVCLYELPSHEGTKSQILAKMRDKYYAGSDQSQVASWEKSASQMLSSASFQKRRGVFTLREEVATPKREQLDVSGTNKQKLTYVLSLLPSRTGTLLDILNAYQISFPSNLIEIADQRKLKDNISKTLNAYDTFDKSLSKTIYYLTQQEILAIDAEQKQMQGLGSNNTQNTSNQHYQHNMYSTTSM